MPTPRPIIETRIGVTVLMSVRPGEDEQQQERGHQRDDRERDRDRASPRTCGRRCSSTMIAASRPSSSEVPCSIGGNSASPLYSTVTPAGATVSRTASSTATTCVAVLVLDRLVELRLGVGDAAVLGERRLAERVADALEAGLAVGGLELVRLELRDRLLDRRLALRRVEPLALRRREDEVQDRALLGGELGLDQVGRLLRVRAGDLELVPQRATDRRDQHDQRDDDPDPHNHDPPRMQSARPRPARQHTRRQPLMRSERARPGSVSRAGTSASSSSGSRHFRPAHASRLIGRRASSGETHDDASSFLGGHTPSPGSSRHVDSAAGSPSTPRACLARRSAAPITAAASAKRAPTRNARW